VRSSPSPSLVAAPLEFAAWQNKLSRVTMFPQERLAGAIERPPSMTIESREIAKGEKRDFLPYLYIQNLRFRRKRKRGKSPVSRPLSPPQKREPDLFCNKPFVSSRRSPNEPATQLRSLRKSESRERRICQTGHFINAARNKGTIFRAPTPLLLTASNLFTQEYLP
jgi:hypothetical protein